MSKIIVWERSEGNTEVRKLTVYEEE